MIPLSIDILHACFHQLSAQGQNTRYAWSISETWSSGNNVPIKQAVTAIKSNRGAFFKQYKKSCDPPRNRSRISPTVQGIFFGQFAHNSHYIRNLFSYFVYFCPKSIDEQLFERYNITIKTKITAVQGSANSPVPAQVIQPPTQRIKSAPLG